MDNIIHGMNANRVIRFVENKYAINWKNTLKSRDDLKSFEKSVINEAVVYLLGLSQNIAQIQNPKGYLDEELGHLDDFNRNEFEYAGIFHHPIKVKLVTLQRHDEGDMKRRVSQIVLPQFDDMVMEYSIKPGINIINSNEGIDLLEVNFGFSTSDDQERTIQSLLYQKIIGMLPENKNRARELMQMTPYVVHFFADICQKYKKHVIDRGQVKHRLKALENERAIDDALADI
jgi:hypothetical protein